MGEGQAVWGTVYVLLAHSGLLGGKARRFEQGGSDLMAREKHRYALAPRRREMQWTSAISKWTAVSPFLASEVWSDHQTRSRTASRKQSPTRRIRSNETVSRMDTSVSFTTESHRMMRCFASNDAVSESLLPGHLSGKSALLAYINSRCCCSPRNYEAGWTLLQPTEKKTRCV